MKKKMEIFKCTVVFGGYFALFIDIAFRWLQQKIS